MLLTSPHPQLCRSTRRKTQMAAVMRRSDGGEVSRGGRPQRGGMKRADSTQVRCALVFAASIISVAVYTALCHIRQQAFPCLRQIASGLPESLICAGM